MSLTSALTLQIRSLTWARIWLFESIVSFIASSTSLFSSSSWASTALCVLASESILFRKVSTGFVKAIAHVIPQRVNAETALIQKYAIGGMALSFSPIRG